MANRVQTPPETAIEGEAKEVTTVRTLQKDRLPSSAEIKARLPLAVAMRKLGMDKHIGPSRCCPFHEDKDPSFGINQQTNVWNCQAGCGGGDVFNFIAKVKGL